MWLLVRPQLSRIDVIGNMTVFQTVLESSSLSFCTLLYRSTMVVRLTVNQEVAGSSPADTALLDSTIYTNLFVFIDSSSISALSSNRLGHRPFTAAIGIRVPVGSY